MFKDAKIGDRVYSIIYGYGIIIVNNTMVVDVKFSSFHFSSYYHDGKYNSNDITPELYWDKPEIIVPPQPKRLVTKTDIFYVNLYKSITKDRKYSLGDFRYDTKKLAEINITNGIFAAGAKVTVEYEIEE